MKVKVSKEALNSVKSLHLEKQFEKQKRLFLEQGPSYPSLNFELLEPKELHIYSFRVNKQYRAKIIRLSSDSYFIIDVVDYH